jgi:hypothetical protein
MHRYRIAVYLRGKEKDLKIDISTSVGFGIGSSLDELATAEEAILKVQEALHRLTPLSPPQNIFIPAMLKEGWTLIIRAEEIITLEEIEITSLD